MDYWGKSGAMCCNFHELAMNPVLPSHSISYSLCNRSEQPYHIIKRPVTRVRVTEKDPSDVRNTF